METILTIVEGKPKRKGAGALAGMEFIEEPGHESKGDFLEALAKFEKKYPYRYARKGEKTATQLLRETRDHR